MVIRLYFLYRKLDKFLLVKGTDSRWGRRLLELVRVYEVDIVCNANKTSGREIQRRVSEGLSGILGRCLRLSSVRIKSFRSVGSQRVRGRARRERDALKSQGLYTEASVSKEALTLKVSIHRQTTK